jgi:hypothetical protein
MSVMSSEPAGSGGTRPAELIESYVSDVVGRLPRRQRADVAVELRALLHEELDGRLGGGAGPERNSGRLGERGGEPDEADAMALLTGFGRPADVAARYRPTFAVIDPVDSRAFVRASVIGVALIWIVGLVDAYSQRPASFGDGVLVFRDFYLTVGLPALMWPGFLVVWFAIAAWVRRRWPRTGVWKPRPAERDNVNRFGMASAAVFWILGTAVLVNPGAALDLVSGGRLPDAGRAAFAYESDFVRLRGPVVLAVIVAQLVLWLAVLVRGRWQASTRRIHLVLNLVTCGVLLWVLFGGSTFRTPGIDQTVKSVAGLIVLGVVIDLIVRFRRQRQRAASAALPGTT